MYSASSHHHHPAGEPTGATASSSTQPPGYSSRVPTRINDADPDLDWDPSPYPTHTYAHHQAAEQHRPRYKSALETRKQATLSAAIAAASHSNLDGSAGLGANASAYRPDNLSAADSPSMYTDPYEFHSSAPPPNIPSTSPHAGAASAGTGLAYPNHAEFLETDPYDRPLQASTNLARADTLVPGDSISSYNVRIHRAPDDTHRREPSHARAVDYQDMRQHSAYPTSYSAGDQHMDDEARDSYDHRPYRSGATALPLSKHTGQMGYAEDEEDEEDQLKRGPAPLFSNHVHHPGARDEEAKSGLLSRFAGAAGGGLPRNAEEKLHQQIQRRRQGVGRQKWAVVSYIMTVALIAVFIVELVKAKAETGQAVQTHPSINPMLGPSSEFLISFGARFVPCMREIAKLPTTTELPCLNASSTGSGTYTQDQLCPLWEICGLKDAKSPDQSYRFISAIFLHAGFVHIIFNLLVLLTLCAQIERLVGSIPYTLIYFAGGIGGNLLGGNFGLIGQPALGASGAIYTCISVELVDLIYNWQYEYRAKTRLVMSLVFSVVGLALGLLPGIDNFSHIGGFCVGILGGLLFAPAIHPTQCHRIVCWILRLVSLGLLVGFFVGLAINFYNSADPLTACTWCRYLSCLPVFSSCKGDGLSTSKTTTTTTTTTGN